jgi:hypothetical protein
MREKQEEGVIRESGIVMSQAMIIQTAEPKSLLSSLYKREEFPSLVSSYCLRTGKERLFDRAHGHELVEWLGEIF